MSHYELFGGCDIAGKAPSDSHTLAKLKGAPTSLTGVRSSQKMAKINGL